MSGLARVRFRRLNEDLSKPPQEVAEFEVELALTAAEREQGLAGRQSLEPGAGMWFSMPASGLITVTTMEMLFPLDVIFVGGDLVVMEILRDVALGQVVASSAPALHFLEVNADVGSEIEAGDLVLVETLEEPQLPATMPSAFTESVDSIVGAVTNLAMVYLSFRLLKEATSSLTQPARPTLSGSFQQGLEEVTSAGNIPRGSASQVYVGYRESLNEHDGSWRASRRITPTGRQVYDIVDPDKKLVWTTGIRSFEEATDLLRYLRGQSVQRLHQLTCDACVERYQVEPWTQLSSEQRRNLDWARAVASRLGLMPRGGIHAAMLQGPPGIRIWGMYDSASHTVYIAIQRLASRPETENTLAHELAHYESGAGDDTEAHRSSTARMEQAIRMLSESDRARAGAGYA